MNHSPHHVHDSCLSLPSHHHHNLHALFHPSSSLQHGGINLQKQQHGGIFSSVPNPGPPFSFPERSSSSISLHQIRGQHQQQQQGHDHHGTLGQHLQPPGHLGFNSADGVGSIRRVFSTGDIQAFSEHVPPETMQHHRPPAHSPDSSSHVLGSGRVTVTAAAGGRVGRYGPEERRERIERYRNKRNQRNFHKKVTYACRKTLADRRPRVHGRFARNDQEGTDVNSAEAMPCGDRRFQAEAAAMAATTAAEDDNYYCYDAQLWNNFADAFSINNLI